MRPKWAHIRTELFFYPYLCKKENMQIQILAGIIGPWQIALIVLVVLLLFGGKKIPELMKGLGKGIREFKDGMSQDNREKNNDEKDVEKKTE